MTRGAYQDIICRFALNSIISGVSSFPEPASVDVANWWKECVDRVIGLLELGCINSALDWLFGWIFFFKKTQWRPAGIFFFSEKKAGYDYEANLLAGWRQHLSKNLNVSMVTMNPWFRDNGALSFCSRSNAVGRTITQWKQKDYIVDSIHWTICLWSITTMSYRSAIFLCVAAR